MKRNANLYSEYATAHEKALKLQSAGWRGIRIDRTADGWKLYAVPPTSEHDPESILNRKPYKISRVVKPEELARLPRITLEVLALVEASAARKRAEAERKERETEDQMLPDRRDLDG